MANGGRIDFTVGFNIDKSGLGNLKNELNTLQKMSPSELLKVNPNIKDINEARSVLMKLQPDIAQIQESFKRAFDPTTGITNITRLQKSLQSIDLAKMQRNFSALGPAGNKAFNQIAAKAMTTNLQFKETNNLLDKIGTTFGNTLKWGISSSIMNTFTGAIQQAWGYVQHLDTSLNDIRIVTGKSADEMDKFAVKANDAAKALGASTTEYTEAALIYYQQGLSDEESQARAETTLKAANVTGQTGREVSEQLTAVWNGYKVTAEETELYVDKLAAVAATTASDLEELSTGMSKVASAANAMGVDIDQLNGMLSTIISVTRQAPETAGTALKTIFARIEDLKISGEDEDGVKLGEVSSTLDEVGVHIMDVNGDIRDLGEVIEEVAGKWDTWTDAQQTAIAQAMAGKRQYNNLLALFNNWDMYSDAVETSRNSIGTLQKQQDIYMESTAAHLQQLKTQWEDLYNSLLDTDSVNSVVDLLTSGLDKVTNFVDAIGGGKGALLGLGAVATNVFNKQISQGLEGIITKFSNAKENAKQLEAELAIVRQYGEQVGLRSSAIEEIVELKEYVQQYYDVMSQEEIQAHNDLIQHAADQAVIKQNWEDNAKAYQKYVQGLVKGQAENSKNKTFSAPTTDSQGNKVYKGQAEKAMNVDIINNKGIEESTKAIDNAIKAAEKLKVTQNEATEAIRKYQEVIKDSSSSQAKVSKAANEMQKALQNLSEAEDNLAQEANLTEKENDELGLSFNKTNEKLRNYIETYTDATKVSSRGGASNALNAALNQQSDLINKITSETINSANKQKEKVGEVQQKYQEANEALQAYKESIRATGQFDTRQLVSGITSIIGGISSIGFAFQSLSSLTKTWSDETTSTFDKVIQTMISLGMVIPGVIHVFEGLNATKSIYNVLTGQQILANGALYSSELVQLSALVMEEEELKKIAIQNGITLEEIQAKIAAKDRETLSLIANTEAWEKNRKAQGLSKGRSVSTGEQGLMKGLPKLKDKVLGLKESFMSGATAAGEFVQSTIGIGTASSAATVGIIALTTAVAAVAAGITIGVIAYNNWKRSLEQSAAAAEQAAEKAKEHTEKLKEQKTVVDEVVQSYKELNKQYGKNQVDELRQATYELCKQHNLQDLAVKALIADYDELNNIIKEAQSTASEEYFKSIDAEKQTIQQAFSAGVWRDLSHAERDKNLQGGVKTIDLKGFGLQNADEKQLAKQLHDLGVDFYSETGESTIANPDHITLDSFAKAATENYEKLKNVLETSATPAAKQLLEILEKQSDNLNRYQELSEQDKNKYANKYQPEIEKISSAEDYDKVRQRMINDSELRSTFTDENGLVDEEALKDWVQSYLNGIDTIKRYAQTSDYAEILTPKFDIDKKDLETQLKNLSDTEFQFVIDNVDLTDAYKDVDDFKEHFEKTIEYLNTQSTTLKVKTVLDSEKDNKFDQEAINDLFNTTTFAQDNGMTQEQFEGLSFEQQKQALLDFYLVANQNATQYKENSVKNLQEEKAAINDNIDALNQLKTLYGEANLESATNGYLDTQVSNITEKVDEAAAAIGELGYTEEEVKSLLSDYNEGVIDAEDERIQKIIEITGYTKEQLARLGELVNIQDDYNKKTRQFNKEGKSYSEVVESQGQALESLDNTYSSVKSSTQDFEGNLEEQKKRMDGINSSIDSLQSAYSSLTSIMEEYNETGVLSMDNLQAILSMDTEYLSALQFENGQMSINEEGLKQIALARLDEAEATAYSEAMAELNALAQQEAAGAAQKVGNATVETAKKVAQASAVVRDGADAWHDYWTQMTNSAGVVDNEKSDAIGQALYNKLQAFGQVRDQIMNGNFSATMKGPTSGASSSESKKEAQHEDYLEREVDLYREVNEQLEQIESTLGRIQKQNSYKWGKDLQKGLERENKLLDQQLDKLKQKAEIQKGDLAQRRANLEAQGIQFSKDGSSMKNAEATLDKMYAQYNSMVDTYNAMSADQQEEYKKQLEDKKKDIDKMENDLKNYESLFGEYQSILDELQELHYKQIENAVERFNNMVDVHLELDEAKKEWNDFWYEVVQDVDDTDFGGKIAQSIGKLQTLVGLGGKASKSQIAELTDHLNDTVHEANKQMDSRERGGEDSLFEDATKLTKENLEKYRDQLMSAVREAKEEVDNIAENYLKQLESAQDLLDKQVEGWEAIGDHIEHNIELIKLVSGEKAFEPILKQYDKLYQNNLNTLNTQRQGQEFWKKQIDRYTAELKKLKEANQENTVQFKTYSEALTEATNNYRKAVADLDKTVEKALKDLQEWRKTQDDAIFDQLEKSLTQGKGLEYVEDEWDLITEKSSKYLDNVERALEIEMYSNDLEKAANATGLSAKNQEKLNQFREEELKKLREKQKLTQYDIDESRARLAIMQAEMALEDQRANKSKMRLRRDSQGNYNYQYVGDESAEEEAENGLLSAKKEWYELVKKRHDELINYEMQNIKKLQEFSQKANEARTNHDMETYKLYKGLMEQLSDEMRQNETEANKNLQDLTSGTAQFFSDVANANILPTSRVTAEAITKDASGVKDAVNKAVADMVDTQNEYDRRTTEILHTAEVNYEDLVSNGVDPTTDSLESLVTSNETLAAQLGDVNTKLDEQQRLLAEAEQGYRNLRDAAVEAITDAERAIERLSQTTIDANQKVQASIAAANAAAQAAASASPGGTGGGGGDTASSSDNDSSIKAYAQYDSSVGADGKKNYYIVQGGKQTGQYIRSTSETQAVEDYEKKLRKGSFATGGYTGAWGDEGKLAILHQKELVLNESDTSNLLKVITMLRDVVASINIGGLADSLVNSTAQWVNSMSAQSFGNNGISNISNITNDTNNYKSMVVNADFSGVRSADAIYQALVELENYGMQQNYSTAPHASKSY